MEPVIGKKLKEVVKKNGGFSLGEVFFLLTWPLMGDPVSILLNFFKLLLRKGL